MSDDKRDPRGGRSADGDLSPRGEDLAAHDLPDLEDYDVVDPDAEELTTPDDTSDDTPDHADPDDMVIDDSEELAEAEKAADAARSTRPVRKSGATARPARRGQPVRRADARTADGAGTSKSSSTKDSETPRRELTTAPVRRKRVKKEPAGSGRKRTGPVTFTKQSVAELRKVKWPTGEELGQYFAVVLVFVLLIIAYVSGLDVLFGWVILKLFGH